MGYLELNEFLTKKEKSDFLKLAEQDNWINHKSTISGEYSPLYFMPCKYKNFERVTLMKMYPKVTQDWHTDGNRKTVLIYPLSENYANGSVRAGEYVGPVLLDVTKEHAVFNNEYTRINLQIGFNERIGDVWPSLKN